MLTSSSHSLYRDLLRLFYALFFLLESGKVIVSLTGSHDFNMMRLVQILVFDQATFARYVTAEAIQLVVLSQGQSMETATGNSNYSVLF